MKRSAWLLPVLALVCAVLGACANHQEEDSESGGGAFAGGEAGAACAESEKHVRDGGGVQTNNDTAEHARILPDVDDDKSAQRQLSKVIGDVPSVTSRDTDWYEFSARDVSSSTSRLLMPAVRLWRPGDTSRSTLLEVCILAEKSKSVTCGVGRGESRQAMSGAGGVLSGCCAGPNDLNAQGELVVQMDLETALNDDTQKVLVSVRRFAGGDGGAASACNPYDFFYWGAGTR